MEPFEHDELSDRELDRLLHEWEVPAAPARLKARLGLDQTNVPVWRRWWGASIRIPLPVACALGVILVFGAWRWNGRGSASPVMVTRAERVEVPVVQEKTVTRTVYRYRTTRAPASQKMLPVAELRPRILEERVP